MVHRSFNTPEREKEKALANDPCKYGEDRWPAPKRISAALKKPALVR